MFMFLPWDKSGWICVWVFVTVCEHRYVRTASESFAHTYITKGLKPDVPRNWDNSDFFSLYLSEFWEDSPAPWSLFQPTIKYVYDSSREDIPWLQYCLVTNCGLCFMVFLFSATHHSLLTRKFSRLDLHTFYSFESTE